MKQERITKAVKIINRSIKFYQRKLTYQLELRAEAKFDNGNLKIAKLGDYESNIKKYEIILADLATIKRAINNNQTSVRIFGTYDCRGYIYKETLNTLKKAQVSSGMAMDLQEKYGSYALKNGKKNAKRKKNGWQCNLMY